MKQYIDKSALVAEIEKRFKEHHSGYKNALVDILSFLNSLEVKEVDLEKEIKEEYLKHRRYGVRDNMLVILNELRFNKIARHFYELGLQVNNPVTAADRGFAEEIIINLKRVENDYHLDLTREMEWLRNKAMKGE